MSPVLHAFFAQTAPDAAPSAFANPIFMMLAIAAVFYFIMFRPQQKQAKQHKAMLETMQKGDEIISNAGIYGTIVSVEDPITVDIGGGTKVRLVKSSVARNLTAERRGADLAARAKTEAKK